MEENAILVDHLVKDYPRVRAVNDISFTVPKGEIFGLLGPNGAGKTTTIRMLLTLVKPTSGKACLFDVDVAKQPEKAREMVGYVPQDVSADGELSGYENILLYAKLYRVPSADREKRIHDALEYLELADRANDIVGHYSGGMMRRLEIAQAMVNRPRLLFLDEPSIGLDPNARRSIWTHVLDLRRDFGTTMILTTHDMSEADVLCDRVGIIDHGKLVTVGPPAQLKSTVGGDIITIASNSPGCPERLKDSGYTVMSESNGHVELVVSNGETVIPHLIDTLRSCGVDVESVSLKKPSLDDVFLKYTGARIEEGEGFQQAKRARQTFRRFTK